MDARFGEALEEILRGIPEGKVATCGAVARALGDVRAARAVSAWILEHPEVAGGRKVVRAAGQAILGGGPDGMPSGDHALPDELPAIGLLKDLRDEQTRLAERVKDVDAFRDLRTVGAVDVAYDGDVAFAAAVRCDSQKLEVEEIVDVEMNVDFPYIPTYLAFRELPPAEAAIRKLRRRPDLLFVDGHGRLHPVLAGFACIAGVRLDLPTIGIAKHPLVGRAATTRTIRGAATPIQLGGTIRGYAWTPPGRGRPIYVSVGHRVSLETALRLTRSLTKKNLPEPLRIADRRSKERKREKWEKGGRQ